MGKSREELMEVRKQMMAQMEQKLKEMHAKEDGCWIKSKDSRRYGNGDS